MKKLIFIFSLAAMCIWGCNKKHERLNSAVEENGEIVETRSNSAVCIWDKISVLQEANEKSKWLTSVNLGEKVVYLNETAMDSISKKMYTKIRLSDNTVGWSRADFIVPNGKAAVFLGDTEFYKRPDLMTKAGSSFKAMDIVAISAEQDGWYEVKGKRADDKYITSGWIRPENVSTKEVDIAVAKYAAGALSKKDNDRAKELRTIIDNADFSDSYFVPTLRKVLMDMESPKIELEDSIDDQVDNGVDETLI